MKLKAKQKTPNCLNCQYPLQQDENYCPKCGQKNQALMTVPAMVSEFLNNLFSYDSRLYRSIIPFLFRPGYLTNAFIKGKRNAYINPVRLYLVVSVLYFFTLTFLVNEEGNQKIAMETKELKQLENKTDTLSLLLRKHETNSDTVKKYLAEIKQIEKKIAQRIAKINQRTKQKEFYLSDEDGDDNIDDAILLIRTEGITEPKQLLKRLHIQNDFWNRLFAQQTIRLEPATQRDLIIFLIGKLSLLTFLMIPAFAFILKVLYIRRKRLYVEHLIFSFNIHSYVFLISLIAFAAFLASTNEAALKPEALLLNPFIPFANLIVLIYGYLSFYFVYKQGWFKTLVKLSLATFIYFVISVISLVVGVVISLLIF